MKVRDWGSSRGSIKRPLRPSIIFKIRYILAFRRLSGFEKPFDSVLQELPHVALGYCLKALHFALQFHEILKLPCPAGCLELLHTGRERIRVYGLRVPELGH